MQVRVVAASRVTTRGVVVVSNAPNRPARALCTEVACVFSHFVHCTCHAAISQAGFLMAAARRQLATTMLLLPAYAAGFSALGKAHISICRCPASVMVAEIVLLQHVNEVARTFTATGPLLSDVRLKEHLSMQTWNWETMADNDRIAELVASLNAPALVWAADIDNVVAVETEAAVNSYILLDGTWVEARTIFDEGPACLRALPRVTLPPAESSFWLRSRLGSAQVPAGSVCTAEAAAGILEQLKGDSVGGDIVRLLLAEKQDAYAALHPHQRPGYDPKLERPLVMKRTLKEWRRSQK